MLNNKQFEDNRFVCTRNISVKAIFRRSLSTGDYKFLGLSKRFKCNHF